MTRKQKKMLSIAFIGAVLALALTLVLFALRNEIKFFYFPREIHFGAGLANDSAFRLGGQVKNGSLIKNASKITFMITDGKYDVPVVYRGLLPDLFREGDGVIAEGILTESGVFQANSVLAKHDENYIPKDVN